MILSKSNDEYPISSLTDRYVRMLANAVFVAPLLQWFQSPGVHSPATSGSPRFAIDTHYWDWLCQLDQDPSHFHQWLQQGELKKLGIFNERLWQFFLSNNGVTRLLAANYPIWERREKDQGTDSKKGRQLGELDLLYEHPDWGVVHLEIASKYFLKHSDQLLEDDDASAPPTLGRMKGELSHSIIIENEYLNAWSSWLGPGRRDRLDIKLKHILSKQITLLDHPLADQTVQAFLKGQPLNMEANTVIGNTTPISKHVHVGGRLFYPIEKLTNGSSKATAGSDLSSLEAIVHSNRSPIALNPHHLKGHWLSQTQWNDFASSDSLLSARLVNKPFWLDHAARLGEPILDSLVSSTAINPVSMMFDNGLLKSDLKDPIMVQIQLSNKLPIDVQAQLVFITPDGWPHDQ